MVATGGGLGTMGVARLGKILVVGVCVATLGVVALPPPTSAGTRTSPVPDLAWSPCADLPGAECATLDVPLDYSRRKGETIQIALARVLATDPARRIGTLLVNPGGPGGSGRPLATQVHAGLLAAGPSSQEVAARFDLVGFDPRGVGASSAVDCGDLEGIDRADYTPDTPAESAALVEAMHAFATACKAGTGKLLGFVGTENAARDMDQIRRALGEKKLTYLGFSYGTQLGATYADLFPKHVRALVLDGAYDPSSTGVASIRDQADSLTAAFDTFADDCAAAPDCAARFPDGLGAAFDRTAQQADAAPLADPTTPGRTTTEGEFVTGVGTALFALPDQEVTDFLHALIERADGSLAGRAFDVYDDTKDGARSNLSEATVAVECLDYRWPKGGAGLRQIVTRTNKEFPRLGQTFLREFLPCAYWPVTSTPKPAPHAKGAPPIVVVGTTGDPAAPYAGAQAMARQLDSGVLLTREGQGHGAYFASACIRDAVNAYLLDLTVPPKGTTCPSD